MNLSGFEGVKPEWLMSAESLPRYLHWHARMQGMTPSSDSIDRGKVNEMGV